MARIEIVLLECQSKQCLHLCEESVHEGGVRAEAVEDHGAGRHAELGQQRRQPRRDGGGLRAAAGQVQGPARGRVGQRHAAPRLAKITCHVTTIKRDN